jgi:hypothetical protein
MRRRRSELARIMDGEVNLQRRNLSPEELAAVIALQRASDARLRQNARQEREADGHALLLQQYDRLIPKIAYKKNNKDID